MTTLERRINAARAYAGFNQDALAQRVELSKRTLKRAEKGERPLYRREVLAIAEACDVPVWFLESGWDGWRGNRGADR